MMEAHVKNALHPDVADKGAATVQSTGPQSDMFTNSPLYLDPVTERGYPEPTAPPLPTHPAFEWRCPHCDGKNRPTWTICNNNYCQKPRPSRPSPVSAQPPKYKKEQQVHALL